MKKCRFFGKFVHFDRTFALFDVFGTILTENLRPAPALHSFPAGERRIPPLPPGARSFRQPAYGSGLRSTAGSRGKGALLPRVTPNAQLNGFGVVRDREHLWNSVGGL